MLTIWHFYFYTKLENMQVEKFNLYNYTYQTPFTLIPLFLYKWQEEYPCSATINMLLVIILIQSIAQFQSRSYSEVIFKAYDSKNIFEIYNMIICLASCNFSFKHLIEFSMCESFDSQNHWQESHRFVCSWVLSSSMQWSVCKKYRPPQDQGQNSSPYHDRPPTFTPHIPTMTSFTICHISLHQWWPIS